MANELYAYNAIHLVEVRQSGKRHDELGNGICLLSRFRTDFRVLGVAGGAVLYTIRNSLSLTIR
jgi:hypothetical protein